MKTLKSFLFLLGCIIVSTQAFSQVSFSISPGLNLNAMQIGFKTNNTLSPYVGFQYLSVKYNYERNRKEFNTTTNTVDDVLNTETISGGLFIPNIGAKYSFKKIGNMQPYISANIAKPIVYAKYEDDGVIDDDVKDDIKNLSLWGGEICFGAEYFFDATFSLSGEFGLRHLSFKYEDPYETSYYNPNSAQSIDYTSTRTTKFKATPTYTKISLNFYFVSE